MKARQVAILLKCQTLREARTRAELGRRVAETAQAETQHINAERAAERHLTQSAEALQQGYTQLVGQSVSLNAFLALQQQESRARVDQAELRQSASEANDRKTSALTEEIEARKHSVIAARKLSQRERISEATAEEGRRLISDREDLGADDAGLSGWIRNR